MLKTINSVPITRPADTTAYASGDLVANSTTAGSVVFPTIAAQSITGHTGRIKRAFVKKTGTGVTNAAFRVHVHNAPIGAPTNGDNGAWLTPQASWLGSYDVTVDKAFTDGALGVSAEANIPFDLAAGNKRLYLALEARGAYTPASAEVFTIALDIDQDPIV